MPSPTCEVKDGAGAYAATTNGIDATPGNTVTIRLVSSAVESWALTCVYTDELSDAAAVTASLAINQTTKTATFTAPVAGRAYIFRSVVNSGYDANGVAQASYVTTFGVFTPTEFGNRCHAVNETFESNSVFGYAADMNQFIRAGGLSAGGWRTVLDVDFTTITDPGVSANGTYTMGGFAGWKRENAANDRVAMAITGSGLTIQPAISVYGATRTAPLLWLPLSALGVPDLDWDTGFRVWMKVASESHDADNSDFVFCGIDSDNVNWSPGTARSGTNGVGGNKRIVQAAVTVNGSYSSAGNTALLTGDWTSLAYLTGILRCEIPKLASGYLQPVAQWKPVGTWPTTEPDPLVRPWAALPTSVTTSDIHFADVSGVGPGAGLGIVVGAAAGSTNDHYSVTITRLRVDYRK